MSENARPRRTLYRGSSTNLCGWCHYHKRGVTPRQMRLKKCLAKQCNAFQKFTEHPLWKQREDIKRIKKQHRAERRAGK